MKNQEIFFFFSISTFLMNSSRDTGFARFFKSVHTLSFSSFESALTKGLLGLFFWVFSLSDFMMKQIYKNDARSNACKSNFLSQILLQLLPAKPLFCHFRIFLQSLESFWKYYSCRQDETSPFWRNHSYQTSYSLGSHKQIEFPFGLSYQDNLPYCGEVQKNHNLRSCFENLSHKNPGD